MKIRLDDVIPVLEDAAKQARPLLKEGKKLAKQATKPLKDDQDGKGKKSRKARKKRLRKLLLLGGLAGGGAVAFKKVMADEQDWQS